MAFKVNYGQQRNDRKRAKEERASERLKKREAAALLRRQHRTDDQPDLDPDQPGQAPGPDDDSSASKS